MEAGVGRGTHASCFIYLHKPMRNMYYDIAKCNKTNMMQSRWCTRGGKEGIDGNRWGRLRQAPRKAAYGVGRQRA